jgi:hypothetical protein
MRCKSGDLVYVELPSRNGLNSTCWCNIGLMFTVREQSTNLNEYPDTIFWKCPLKPMCEHFPKGVRSFDDRLLRPVRGDKKPEQTTLLEKSDA